MRFVVVFAILFTTLTLWGDGTRLKNVVTVKGVRSQQLVGYGLVVGLNGTGDGQGALFTVQSIANMLSQMGVKIDSKRLKVKNVAGVIVTAELPPFSDPGTKIDVTVSSLGDAKSIEGGTLLMTPLKGADGRVYAVAQGQVTVGGFSGGGTRKNHVTTAVIPGGAIVERALDYDFVKDGKLTLVLNDPDFTTAYLVANSVNRFFSEPLATPLNAREVSVRVKDGFTPIKMIAFLEQITVSPDRRAVVVLNERTGTVVMGGDIVVRDVAIAHGNLTITVRTKPFVSQPLPFSKGKTVQGEVKESEVKEEKRPIAIMPGGKISDLVDGLNRLGVSPRDLISILEALKKAGAIDADIKVM